MEYFHGTTSKNLDSILELGLSSNESKQKFPSVSMRAAAGLKPFGGIYLGCFDVAREYAKGQSKRYGGNPLIITVKYAFGSNTAMDDDVTVQIIRYIEMPNKKVNTLAERIRYALTFLYGISSQNLDKIVTESFVSSIESLLTNKSIDNWKSMSSLLASLIPYIKKSITMQIDPNRRLRHTSDIKFTGMPKIISIDEYISANEKKRIPLP